MWDGGASTEERVRISLILGEGRGWVWDGGGGGEVKNMGGAGCRR